MVLVGGLERLKKILLLAKGADILGVDQGDAVPAIDDFLKKAQETWYPDAPMDKVKKFTVEGAEHIDFQGEGAMTIPLKLAKTHIYTGTSNVYFNKDVAFSSAGELFKTMGHELVHVSQIANVIKGLPALARDSPIRNIMEYHAYLNHAKIVAGTIGNSFGELPNTWIVNPELSYFYKAMNSINFSWTFNYNFTLISH